MENDEHGASVNIFYKKRRKEQGEKRKRNAVLRWLSSFAVTAAVVVAVVSAGSQGATAEITSLECVGTDIVYGIEVSDENKTLTEGSLYLIAESPLDTREVPLETGSTSGRLTSLLPNTEYTVSVVGSEGFGRHSLDKKKVKTGKTCAGRITSVTLAEQAVDNPAGQTASSYQCEVTLFYNDSKNEISSVYAEYAFSCLHKNEQAAYTAVSVTSTDFAFFIPDLPYTNGSISVRLMAILKTGETVLLDETAVYAPYVLFASVYVYPVTADSVTVSVYPYGDLPAQYTAVLSKDGVNVDSQLVTIEEGSNGAYTYYYGWAQFINLEEGTAYTLEVGASYLNPYTVASESQSLYKEEVTTAVSGGGIIPASGEIVSAFFNIGYYGEDEPYYNCPITVTYTDTNSEYSAIYIDFVYQYYGEETSNPEYTRIPVTANSFEYTVFELPYTNGSLDVKLIADTASGEVLLDQNTFYAPFIVFADAYPEETGFDFISMIVYPYWMLDESTLYTAQIRDPSGTLIQTANVELEIYGEDDYTVGYVSFFELTANTEYNIELFAYFLNPFIGEYETQLCCLRTIQTQVPTE